jgi:formylglycine-generating enzyme required for sulfatase activity
VLVLVLALAGCSPKNTPLNAPAGSPADAPVTAPADRPVADRLAEARQTLEQHQQQRRNLLRDRKVELAQLTANLKTDIRRAGLDLDQALAQLKQPPPQGPLAELAIQYRRCAQLEVHVRRLTDAIAQEQVRLGRLQLAEDNIRQQADLQAALAPQDRDAAEKLLTEADAAHEFNPETILDNPALAAELEGGFQQVQATLRHRASLLPKRPEKTIDELPPLPKLAFATTVPEELDLQSRLQRHLEAGRAEASKVLGAKQPEAALQQLRDALAKACQELNAHPEPVSWKDQCLQELQKTETALTEQLAAPYVAAIERAIPAALENENWDEVLVLLEELIRLAPAAAKLPDLVRRIDVNLRRLDTLGDVDAAVARQRFDEIRRALSLPFEAPAPEPVKAATAKANPVTAKRAETPLPRKVREPVSRAAPGQINFTAWQQTHAALVAAARRFLELEAEYKRLLIEFQEDSPAAEQKRSELAQQRQAVAAALTARDRAEQAVYEQYQRLMDGRQAAYQRLIAELKMRPTAVEPVQVQAQIAALRGEQAAYEAGYQRAGGRGDKLEFLAFVRTVGWLGVQPGDVLTLTYRGVAIPLRWCPPGSFRMGSSANEAGRSENETQVNVTLSTGFWMAETETTQRLWQAVIGTTIRQLASQASATSSFYGEGPEYPVYYVSHEDASEFCRKLTTQLAEAGTLPDGWQIALPSEAQWEYACRAETTTTFCYGDDEGQLARYAWYDGNAAGSSHPVGQKEPNAWGLRDVHGNVWEWCRDGYQDKLLGGTDPEGLLSASSRVNRGGCWIFSAAICRSASRSGHSPSYRYYFLGFRLAAVQSSR